MAQPNVAREPSMEEILASIRRIIESNEPNSDGVSPRSLPPVYDDDGEIESIEDINFGHDAAANDPGEAPQHQPEIRAREQATAAPAERSLSLADVAARVRAASARQQEAAAAREPAIAAPQPAAVRPSEERLSPSAIARLVDLEEPKVDVAAPQPAPAPVAAAPENLLQVETPVYQEPVIQQAIETPILPSEQLRPAVAAEPAAETAPGPQSLPARIEEAANLLSDEAGAQVARSFGELAAVFDGIERRSVEDMAREMLRPMLQEWLDDNLPTLVERLVREEIERVARGPRR